MTKKKTISDNSWFQGEGFREKVTQMVEKAKLAKERLGKYTKTVFSTNYENNNILLERMRDEKSKNAQEQIVANRRLQAQISTLLQKRTKSHDLSSTQQSLKGRVEETRRHVSSTHKANVVLSAQVKNLDNDIAAARKEVENLQTQMESEGDTIRDRIVSLRRAKATLQRAYALQDLGRPLPELLESGKKIHCESSTKDIFKIKTPLALVRRVIGDKLWQARELMETNLNASESILSGLQHG